MNYLTTTFSPSMLGEKTQAIVEETDFETFRSAIHICIDNNSLCPAIGHQNTAFLLARKLGIVSDIYRRVDLKLAAGDGVFCAIPQFRPPETRGFTDKEIEEAEFRYFVIYAKRKRS